MTAIASHFDRCQLLNSARAAKGQPGMEIPNRKLSITTPIQMTPIRKRVCPLLLLVAALACHDGLCANEPSLASQQAEPNHVRLVGELGAGDYEARERAALELRKIGIEAKPALLEGLRSEDLEIRMRAHRLLVQILQADFEQLINAFVNGRNEGERNLPGWPLLRSRLGDKPVARRLYAEMLRSENELLVALGNQESSLTELFDERVEFLSRSHKMPTGQSESLKGPTLATLLLAASQIQQSTTDRAQSFNPSVYRLSHVLNYRVTLESLRNAAYGHQVRQLLATWVESLGNASDKYSRSYALNLSLRFELSDQGVTIARKVLTESSALGSSVPYAAIVLARFGSLEDIKYLKPHLGNKRVFHTWSNKALKKEPIRIQVRDAVLAMMILLQGEDPAKHGFRLLKKDETTIYKVYTLGFLEDSDRDETFQKWAAANKGMGDPG
jgi:hypothetical protein